ncbi:MAG: hypothetical protein IJW08_00155, partial [Lentisphaeria bacterium]|nr:hypothetical protein [Lentisphaeria bacterium]
MSSKNKFFAVFSCSCKELARYLLKYVCAAQTARLIENLRLYSRHGQIKVNKNYCPICCEEKFPAVAHCGQSRALLLRCFGHVQSYTPSAARAQNTTLTHTAST